MLLSLVRNLGSLKTLRFMKNIGCQSEHISRTMSSEKLTTLLTNVKSVKEETVPSNLQKTSPKRLRHEKIQQAAKKKTTAYAPGTVNLQILGNGANGSPSVVYMFTDQSRYLFNCGEGTQRLAHEHKTKLARLEQIFVTRNTWPAIGGMPGLALTVQDAGVKELSLHGPPYLDSILNSMKRFVVLKNLQMKTIDATQETEFEDSVMSVRKIPLFRTEKCNNNNTTSDKVVLAYVCKLKPRAGALNLHKCVAHGVPPGPLLGLLKNGIDVTLENGTVVKSEDVSEPNEKPVAFVIIDIPSNDFLPALESKMEELLDDALTLVIHLGPADVLEDNCYKNFINKYESHVQHLYLNATKNIFSGYIAAHRLQYHLNQLNSNIFPLLAESKEVESASCLSKKLKKTKLSEGNVAGDVETHSADSIESISSLTYYHLRPHKGLDRTAEAKLNPIEYIEETQELENFTELQKKLHADSPQISVENNKDTYPKITFLGTGSCIPNKTRNVSSILIQSAKKTFILLDCGEGTLGQIKRFFGNTKAEEVIRNLHAIYISHLHADHHIGLIGLINERQRLLGENFNPNLLVFAPLQIEPWLHFYDSKISCISDSVELIGNSDILQNPLQIEEKYPHIGLQSIQTCLVRHCPHSFGVRLTINAEDFKAEKEAISVTYSGDTMPCEDLVELGHRTTILIHEATMEDDLVEEARLKTHSTITQAINQGRAMEAKHIILTHFSQRYAKLPRMRLTNEVPTSEEDNLMENVSIAFDNMHISLPELKHFHIMYPALRALFAEHAEELELKALKRELKLERKRKLLENN